MSKLIFFDLIEVDFLFLKKYFKQNIASFPQFKKSKKVNKN